MKRYFKMKREQFLMRIFDCILLLLKKYNLDWYVGFCTFDETVECLENKIYELEEVIYEQYEVIHTLEFELDQAKDINKTILKTL